MIMINKFLRICFALFIGNVLFGQKTKDSVYVTNIKLLDTNYKNFIIKDRNVYAITDCDSLIVFNLNNEKKSKIIPNISSIGIDKNGLFYYTNLKGDLYKTLNFKKKRFIINTGDLKNTLLFTKDDKYVLINSKGLFYDEKCYVPKDLRIYSHRRNSKDKITKFLRTPNVSFLDSKNRVWLTYDNGEFGEEIYFFDLNEKMFYSDEYLFLNKGRYKYSSKEYDEELRDSFPEKIKIIKDTLIYKFPCNLPISEGVKGISENNKNEIFISQSLMHFFVSGSLSIIKDSEYKDFYETVSLNDILEYIKINDSKYKDLNEYIGICTFNKFNNSFYYYSDKGFFQIIENNNKYLKQFIFRPWILWKAGLPNSIGYQMNVKKMEFINEIEFVFLTSNNGIGYFDGKNVTYFK